MQIGNDHIVDFLRYLNSKKKFFTILSSQMPFFTAYELMIAMQAQQGSTFNLSCDYCCDWIFCDFIVLSHNFKFVLVRVESGSDDPDYLGHLGHFWWVKWVSCAN